MDVFDLVLRACEAHGALTCHFACSTPTLEHALELINGVKLQTRRVNNKEAQSATRERVCQALDNQMVAFLAQLEDIEVPEAASENLPAFYAWQVETLEAHIAELQAQLA